MKNYVKLSRKHGCNTWQLLLLEFRGYGVPRLRIPCSKPFSSITTSLSNPIRTEFTVVQSSSDEEPSSPQPPLIILRKIGYFIVILKYYASVIFMGIEAYTMLAILP